MAVSLPTAADVRKVRKQAAKNAAERAEAVRQPLLAVLGAGDLAVTKVSKAIADARSRATAQAEGVQGRVADLPQRFNTDELRKAVAELRAQAEKARAQAEKAYADFAGRGEKAWGRIRKQPQVEQAFATLESYTDKLDKRVDSLVDDAHDAAEKALATITTQTRSTGERVARATQRFTGQAAEAVSEAGDKVAETISEAGDEVAHEARSNSRKVAGRTAPKTAPARKPATRRTSTANGTKANDKS
jgi:heparin binding hemagglutinin HbhA